MPVYLHVSGENQEPIYGVVDYESMKAALFNSLYTTHFTGPFILAILASVEMGFPFLAFALSSQRMYDNWLHCECPTKPSHFTGSFEHTLAIACGDNFLKDESLEDVQHFYSEMAKTSIFAEVWWLHAGCS